MNSPPEWPPKSGSLFKFNLGNELGRDTFMFRNGWKVVADYEFYSLINLSIPDEMQVADITEWVQCYLTAEYFQGKLERVES